MEKLILIDEEEKKSKLSNSKYKTQLKCREIVKNILDSNVKNEHIELIIQFLALELEDNQKCREIYNIFRNESQEPQENSNKKSEEEKTSLIL